MHSISELSLFDGSIYHLSNYIALLILNSKVKPSMPAGSFLWNRRTSLHVWNRFREGKDIEKHRIQAALSCFSVKTHYLNLAIPVSFLHKERYTTTI
jgi:hypothetical protein